MINTAIATATAISGVVAVNLTPTPAGTLRFANGVDVSSDDNGAPTVRVHDVHGDNTLTITFDTIEHAFEHAMAYMESRMA
jgi:hypothetical protein